MGNSLTPIRALSMTIRAIGSPLSPEGTALLRGAVTAECPAAAMP